MKIFRSLAITFLCSLSFTVAALEVDKASALKFFNNFSELENKYDPAVASMYSDTAAVKAKRTYPNGQVRVLEIPGKKWKELLVTAMPLAKIKGDKSIYSNIQVSVEGQRAKIKADRYSALKCYTDKGYYLIIEKSGASQYLIVEEYNETQPQSNC